MTNYGILDIIPQDQQDRIFNGPGSCEIDGEFMGFLDIYEAISRIVPKDWTVIDLGCAYNPQCFFFKDHKEYIAVDIGNIDRFKSDNCTFYIKRINDFIRDDIHKFDLSKTFAICSYVPTNTKLIRETFENLYIYYPS